VKGINKVKYKFKKRKAIVKQSIKMFFESINKVVEFEVEAMLVRIGAKYGIAMSELRACAFGESQVGEVEGHQVLVAQVGEVESNNVESESHVESCVVYPCEVESEWLLELDEKEDVKVRTYEEVSKLCEDLESCSCVVELEVEWLRVMSCECVALCKSDGILLEKYEEALFRYEVLKDSYERREKMDMFRNEIAKQSLCVHVQSCVQSGVEESKEESVTERMSESSVEEMCEWEAKILVSRLIERVSLCECVLEVDELWKELSAGCVSVCNSSAELSWMVQSLIKEVGAKKESLIVESEVSEVSRSLMEESYQYVASTVEVGSVEVVAAAAVATVEVVAPAAKKAAKAKVVKEKVVKEKVVKEKVVKEKKSRVAAASSEVVSAAASASSSSEVVSSGVKVAKEKKEKVVKEKVAKEKVVKEKKVKESAYRGGLFASLVTAAASSGVEESKEESDVEEESSSRCYIVSKKEAACAAAQKMSSELPRLNR